ncbi:MAG TPA: peptidase S8, partial [Micromonosporaceae bacterium]|nr:peptidase S8 [Micromonosporaceae bacterium]
MSYIHKRLGIGPPRLGGWRSRAAGVVAAVAVLALAATGLPANAGPAGPRAAVDSRLLNQLQQETSTGFLVYLREQADLSGAAELSGSDAKAEYVYKQLARTAERSQAGLLDALDAAGASYRPYWISNAVWVEGDSALVEQIAARSEVLKIEAEKAYPVVLPRVEPDGPHVNAVEWGLTNIEAPRVWTEFGVRGEGITVANIDTGVDFDHPAV